MFRKRKIYLWIFAGAALILIMGCLVCNYFINKSEPLLKVVVRTRGVLIFAGNEEYYAVFPNGNKQKIDAFKSMNVESYRLDEHNTESGILIDNITGTRIEHDSPLYEIAYSIVELVKEVKRSENYSITELYVLDGRYFFTVFDFTKPSFLFSVFYNSIYEYFPDEKRISKIVEFKSKSFEHLELYYSE